VRGDGREDGSGRGAHVVAAAAAAATVAPVATACVARYEYVSEGLGDLGPGVLAGQTLVNLMLGHVRGRGGDGALGARARRRLHRRRHPVLPASIGRLASRRRRTWSRSPPRGVRQRRVAFLEGAAYAARHGVEPSGLRSLVQRALRLLEETVEDAARARAEDNYATYEGTISVQLDGMLMVRDAMEREGQRGTLIRALCDVVERGGSGPRTGGAVGRLPDAARRRLTPAASAPTGRRSFQHSDIGRLRPGTRPFVEPKPNATYEGHLPCSNPGSRNPSG